MKLAAVLVLLSTGTAVADEDHCNPLYVEPSLWGSNTTGELRHAFGYAANPCDAVSLHAGVRLDLGGTGGFVGGEAELLFGSPSARLGINVTGERGSAARTSIGARLRLRNVWIGVDAMRTTPNRDGDSLMETSTGVMFGFGLGGNAGIGFATAEFGVLYGAGRVLAVGG